MGDNPLIVLQRFAPRKNFTQLENFTTEAFAWLLRNEPAAEKAFINLLKERLSESSDKNHVIEDATNGQWKTQERLKSGTPDLVGKFENFILVIEVKIEAGGDPNQLNKYLDDFKTKGKENGRQKQVLGVFLGKYPWQCQNKNADCELLWEEVYVAMKDAVEGIEDAKEKLDIGNIKTFLEFMQFNGLDPGVPLTTSGWKYALDVYHMREFCKKTMEEVHANVNYLKQKGKLSYELNRLEFKKERWGRVGLEFSPRSNIEGKWWIPNIFVGFVVDPTDHRLIEIFDEGVIFGMVFDVDQSYFNELYSSQEWANFCKKLEQKANENNWDFFNVCTAVNPEVNEWHPLVIYKPVLKIWKEISQNQEKLVDSIYLKEKLDQLTVELIELLHETEGYQELLDYATELARNNKTQHS